MLLSFVFLLSYFIFLFLSPDFLFCLLRRIHFLLRVIIKPWEVRLLFHVMTMWWASSAFKEWSRLEEWLWNCSLDIWCTTRGTTTSLINQHPLNIPADSLLVRIQKRHFFGGTPSHISGDDRDTLCHFQNAVLAEEQRQ
jgi:hypothetical protein